MFLLLIRFVFILADFSILEIILAAMKRRYATDPGLRKVFSTNGVLRPVPPMSEQEAGYEDLLDAYSQDAFYSPFLRADKNLT